MINNEQYTVPSQALQVLESYIPFGNDYVIFTETYSNSDRVYTAYYKSWSEDQYHVVKVRYVYSSAYNNYYSVIQSDDISLSSVSVAYPYYSYSNIKNCGIYTKLPSEDSLQTFLLIVICSLVVLRTVFGGIKLWSEKLRG